MSRYYGSLSSILLALTLGMGGTTAARAAPHTPAFSGTVSMVIASLALGVGAEWGSGILTLSNGKQYRFAVQGIELGSVGAAKAFLHGRVYDLPKLEDFAGLYGAVEVAMTLVGGPGGMAMRNPQGVVIYLESVEQGVQMTLGAAGVEIKLED